MGVFDMHLPYAGTGIPDPGSWLRETIDGPKPDGRMQLKVRIGQSADLEQALLPIQTVAERLARRMIEREENQLSVLLRLADEMPCGILFVRGSAMTDDYRFTLKTVMGFHPSVPAGEIRYVTQGVIDWDVLEMQLVKLGGEHGGEDGHGEPDDRRRGEG